MWGAPAKEPEPVDTNQGEEEEEEQDVEDMNFAEKLSAVVGVLFVEKYEYTVDGLYYGANMIGDSAVATKDKMLGMCGCAGEAPADP